MRKRGIATSSRTFQGKVDKLIGIHNHYSPIVGYIVTINLYSSSTLRKLALVTPTFCDCVKMLWNFRFRQRSRLEEAGIPSTIYALSNTPTMVGTVDIEIAGYGYGLSFLFPLSFTSYCVWFSNFCFISGVTILCRPSSSASISQKTHIVIAINVWDPENEEMDIGC